MGPPALAPKSLICWILFVLVTPADLERRGQVVALEGVVGQIETGRGADLVAAAAGDAGSRRRRRSGWTTSAAPPVVTAMVSIASKS